MKNTIQQLLHIIGYALKGSRSYYCWLGILGCFLILGINSYYHHLVEGLEVTNMSDQVSWGLGVANFFFYVGIAAAAVVIVYPAYVYHKEELKPAVIIVELMAFCAIVMCLMFICSDIGHPERFWHMLPIVGKLNLPYSLLAWDVVIFNIFLVLDLYIPAYLLCQKYRGLPAKKIMYMPFTWATILFAGTLHNTITAFILWSLASRAYWNSSLLPPRFIVSSFASGPAVMIIIFEVMKYYTRLPNMDSVIRLLRKIMMVMLPVNLFLLLCEMFKELYPHAARASSSIYLFFGLEGHNILTRWIWTALVFDCIATVLILMPRLTRKNHILILCCVLSIVSIWIEKGMGLILPGFLPTPLGEIVEYYPNFGEIFVSLGVLALGALMFTLMAKVAVGIMVSDLQVKKQPAKKVATFI
ncbi:MAG: hypothetical protein ACD_73C00512G0002 [uncultured bacterium]|nr:MAG: hypothetical protein ACD_73C00512G0002 [uncultured bacterium]